MDNLHIRSRLAVLEDARAGAVEGLPATFQWHNRKPHQNFVSARSSQNGTVREARTAHHESTKSTKPNPPYRVLRASSWPSVFVITYRGRDAARATAIEGGRPTERHGVLPAQAQDLVLD